MIRGFIAMLAGCMIAGCASSARNIPLQEFRCDDGVVLSLSFQPDRVLVVMPNGEVATLAQQRSGSGFRYASDRHELYGKGHQISWTNGQRPPTTCLGKPI